MLTDILERIVDDPIDAEIIQFGLVEGSVSSKETHPGSTDERTGRFTEGGERGKEKAKNTRSDLSD